MLTMDLEQLPAAGTFAGFTLAYTGSDGISRNIKNLLNFPGTDGVTESDVSPFQTFKWVHFPGSFTTANVGAGNFDYHATPRFFDANKQLLPLDAGKKVSVTIPVGDFEKGGISVGFTRAFMKSQAYANRYGANTRLKPATAAGANWLFDTSEVAGHNTAFGDFTYEDMYLWLGYTARRQIYEALDEAIGDNTITVEMFAYDLNDPGVAKRCLELADKGRIRIILDNAALHTTPGANGTPTEENNFEQKFIATAKPGAAVFRCRFGRYSHCKVVILKKNGAAFRVLTGSTNFALTGICVNANHVITFDRPDVAQYYSDVFNACWMDGKADTFKLTNFATGTKKFTGSGIPKTEIEFSPHNDAYAENLLDTITAHVKDAATKSVLFAVMEMGETSSGSLIKTLRELHRDDGIYTYGVTDNSSGDISLYKPGRKNGLLINAKSASRELPLPFKTEPKLPGHAIHHKFLITNFNKPSARVYCGSSNLALGGEKANGDNLLCIKDQDVATVFAIEALRLTDHYNFRSVREGDIGPPNQPPAKLDNTGNWVNKFFDPNDIRCVEREIMA